MITDFGRIEEGALPFIREFAVTGCEIVITIASIFGGRDTISSADRPIRFESAVFSRLIVGSSSSTQVEAERLIELLVSNSMLKGGVDWRQDMRADDGVLESVFHKKTLCPKALRVRITR
jgi:hypothetical protein